MDKAYLIKLTSVVYSASQWWSDDNFLKLKLRNLANEILIDFILISHKNPGLVIQERIFRNIQAIQQGLNQARAQKLINRNDFLMLKTEYKSIKNIVKPLEIKKTLKPIEKPQEQALVKQVLSSRQKKILEILKQKQRAQVGELKESFIDTSKRTLRRDLEGLLKKDLVQRIGEWNKIFYVLNEQNTGQG